MKVKLSRWAILLLAVCLALGTGALSWRFASSGARRHWAQAQAAAHDLDFPRAQEHLRAYVGFHPGSAAARFLLARSCRRARPEAFAEARRQLREAARLGWPADDIELERAALDFQSSEASEQDYELLQNYLEARPDREPLILEALARGCLRAGLLNKANAWLDQWVRNHPQDWYARLWRGALFQHAGKPHLAVEDYRQVLRHRPDDPAVARRLGLVLVASGYDFPGALGHLERARTADPADPDVLVALAQCYRVLRTPEEAHSPLQLVLKQQPQHADALLALAVVKLDLNQEEAALRTLDRLEPLAMQFDARAALQSLLRLEPVANPPHETERKEKLLHLKATALRQFGRTEEAQRCQLQLQKLQADVADLKKAMREQKARPRDPDLLYRLGRLHLDIGMGEEGERWLLRLLEVQPDDRRAHQALAEHRQRQARGKP